MSRRLAALLGTLLLPVAPACAEDGTLLDLLRRVPLAELAAEPSATVHVGDLAAAEQGGMVAWIRAGSAPMALSVGSAIQDGIWADRVGFGPADVEATLTVLVPPRRGLVVRLSPAAVPAVRPALLARGYAPASRDGLDALVRGEEDLAVSPGDRDYDDPLGGDLGTTGRAVLQGPDLLWSNEWPMLLDLARPLDPDPRLDALVDALHAPDWNGAPPLQAYLWLRPTDFAAGPPLDRSSMDGPMRDDALAGEPSGAAPGIPPWSLALLADMDVTEGDLALVLFAYSDRASAEEAAARLAQTASRRPLIFDTSLASATDASTSTQVLGDGPYVAALVFRGEIEGRAFRSLTHAWGMGELAQFGPG